MGLFKYCPTPPPKKKNEKKKKRKRKRKRTTHAYTKDRVECKNGLPKYSNQRV